MFFSRCCHAIGAIGGKRSGTIEQAHQFFLSQSARDDDFTVAVYPESLELHEIRQVAGAAFGGKTVEDANEVTLYVLQHLHLENDHPERQNVTAFALGFLVSDALSKNGTAIGLRDTKTGQVKAVVVFREYQPAKENNARPGLRAKIADFITTMKAYRYMKNDPIGIPQSLNDKNNLKAFEGGFEAIDSPMKKMFQEWHCQHGPSEPHWYVNFVGTHCDFQRQGHGQKLMSVLNQAANEFNMACYLESAGQGTDAFYKKLGYETTKDMTMDFSSELLGDLSHPGHLMTRHPKK